MKVTLIKIMLLMLYLQTVFIIFANFSLFRRYVEKTEAKIRWAVRLFNEWLEQRNKMANTDMTANMSPVDPSLEEMTVDELNFCVSRFITKVRKADGNEYPPDTLYSLVISIQLYMEKCDKITSS